MPKHEVKHAMAKYIATTCRFQH